MFRNRQSSQKPPDELFERFRQSFPDVINVTTNANTKSEPAVADPIPNNRTFGQTRFSTHEDLDPTPRAPAEPFRFTPSLTPSAFMDPTSAAFAAFANQPPGLFTPTPGNSTTSASYTGANSLAGTLSTAHDLQTPNLGITLGTITPITLPNSTSLPATADPRAFITTQPIHQFNDYQPFTQSLNPQFLDPTQYGPRPPSGPGSPMDLSGNELPLSLGEAANDVMSSAPFNSAMQLDPISQIPPTSERFRFHVVLNAPTAMIKHPEEIPVTYLNKGQAYAISIVDTQPSPPSATPLKYRIFIRVSFHDETQRNRPAACWQLWKEGRGTNEAHQRGGKLQAVEYVENQANGDEDKKKRGKVTLESSSFDGFSIIWAPTPGGPTETSVSVRFNFLSTDFSHSKGVKGIPVRLCAKSEVLSSGSPGSPPESSPEVCYCKVKLFRDHGAERKLSNDIMHVKKSIDKLKQQASQMDGTGMKTFGKKSKGSDEFGKPGKVPKHKRTWSMSSASSVTGARSHEEDTNAKLQAMQDMFSSTRPVSVLYLRGDDGDDPDLYPVRLPGDPDLEETWAHRRASVATTNTTASSFISPTPSSVSLTSLRADSFSPEKDWPKSGLHSVANTSQPELPVKVRTTSDDGMLSGWIEAVGIDPSYQPPTDRPVKAVMCIYILPVVPNEPEKQMYHRAVYLQSRTASCLSASISAKCGIDPTSIYRTVHVNPRGLIILVDDELVSQMNEGQDMKVQLEEISEESAISSPPGEWSTPASTDSNGSKQWELRLMY